MTTWLKHAQSTVATAGYRSSRPRQQVMMALSKQDCCVSAQQIYAQLSARVGVASVYRALDILEQLNLVKRIDIDAVSYYERLDASQEHHHHRVCVHCGEIELFTDANLQSTIEALEKKIDTAIISHEVTLRVVCSECVA